MVGIVTLSGSKKKKYTTDYCLKCEFKNECTSQYRRIIYDPYDPIIEKIRQLYYSQEGQEIYYLRGHFAETSFALLLEIRNHRGIKTKGLEKVNNEMTIHEIHHNIKKFEKHTTNNFLKYLLKYIKKYKKQHGKINFISLEEIREKLIIENNIIKGIRNGKKDILRKKNKTFQSRL